MVARCVLQLFVSFGRMVLLGCYVVVARVLGGC